MSKCRGKFVLFGTQFEVLKSEYMYNLNNKLIINYYMIAIDQKKNSFRAPHRRSPHRSVCWRRDLRLWSEWALHRSLNILTYKTNKLVAKMHPSSSYFCAPLGTRKSQPGCWVGSKNLRAHWQMAKCQFMIGVKCPNVLNYSSVQ